MLKNRSRNSSQNSTCNDDDCVKIPQSYKDDRNSRKVSTTNFKCSFVWILMSLVAAFVVCTMLPSYMKKYDERGNNSYSNSTAPASSPSSFSSFSALNLLQMVLPSSNDYKSNNEIENDCHVQVNQSRYDIDAWPPSCIVDNVANDRNQVVIVTVNCGYLDMADNYIHSLLKLNVTNFIIVAMDPVAEEVLGNLFPGHVVPVMPGQAFISTKRSSYLMGGFKEITSARPTILYHFLKKGYTIFYNDVDIVWLGNAWQEFDDLYDDDNRDDYNHNIGGSTSNTSIGAVFTDDVPSGDVCSCMIFMKSSQSNMDYLMEWYDEIVKDNPQGRKAIKEHKQLYDRDDKAHKYCNHDQCFLNRVIFRNGNNGTQHFPPNFRKSTRLPSGRQYFSQYGRYDPTRAWVVHANWILTYDMKVRKLRERRLWNPMFNLSASVNCRSTAPS